VCCLSLAASHECHLTAALPDCQAPEPGGAQECTCPDPGLILSVAKPEPALNLATLFPDHAGEAVAAVPVPLPANVFQHTWDPVARSGPPDLHLLPRTPDLIPG
jgi:hypothetical protein